MNQKIKKTVFVLVLMILGSTLLLPQDQLPLHIKKFSDKAIMVKTGDYMQTIGVVALSTKKGIVVIETSLTRTNDLRIKKAIEKEFKRNDFKYLINTHYHHDHTSGNQIYADATIIAHQNCKKGMKSELTGEYLIKKQADFKERIKGMKEEINKLDPDSDRCKFYQEAVVYLSLALKDWGEGFKPTYPNKTFEREMVLDLGDFTLKLFWMPCMHTDSDIMIYIPEEKLLAVGDIPPGPWLPYLRKEKLNNLNTTLKNWKKILAQPEGIKHINTAHWDMTITPDQFRDKYHYIVSLLQGIKASKKKGLTLAQITEKFPAALFPKLKNRIIKSRNLNLHHKNLEAFYHWVSDKQSK